MKSNSTRPRLTVTGDGKNVGGLGEDGVWIAGYVMGSQAVSLTLFASSDTPRDFVQQRALGANASDIDIGGQPGVVFDTSGPTGGLSAHVIWDLGDHVAWLTGHSDDAELAVELARSVLAVPEAEWSARVTEANADG